MNEIALKYGCNPHQASARLYMAGRNPPLEVRNGQPSYINMLDALTGWQLVRELSLATAKPAAASYKHVSPAGAAIAGPVDETFARSQMLDAIPQDPQTLAYVRARGADRVSSFGDTVAVSHVVTVELASLLRKEVSDGIIAPAYEPEALEILKAKKSGRYIVLQIDPAYEPPEHEGREIFGFELRQQRDQSRVGPQLFQTDMPRRPIPDDVAETLTVATIALKYTQSNSVALAWQGQLLGMAAGQQSRIHCTRLACTKAEVWMLQTHPKVLGLPFLPGQSRPDRSNAVDRFIRWDELTTPERTLLRSRLTGDVAPITADEREAWFATFRDLCLSSDAFIPFRDNIDRAARTGVRYVAHAGGSLRDEEVREAAAGYGMTVIETGLRCFLH